MAATEDTTTATSASSTESAPPSMASASSAAPPSSTTCHTLVVYFSASGNTKKVVAELARLVAAAPGNDVTVVELKDTKERTGFFNFFKAGYDAMVGNVTVLAAEDPALADLSRYHRVVMGGPIWAWTLCTPLLTWARARKADLVAASKAGTRLALVSTQGGSGHDKAVVHLKAELAGADVAADVVCNQKDLDNDSFKIILSHWVPDILLKL
ncbi:hypothetical protein Pelo_8799 [Pelomyxa schiedti]|nr:hypothetical protein Pelo_8799 [Pelomyxa schiedti]